MTSAASEGVRHSQREPSNMMELRTYTAPAGHNSIVHDLQCAAFYVPDAPVEPLTHLGQA